MLRADKIVRAAGLQSGEAILLTKPSNIFYASGYPGEGIAVIADGLRFIVTDFRYTEAAGKQAPDFQIYQIEPGISHEQVAYDVLKEKGISRLRFEDDHVTVADFARLQKDMPGVEFVPVNGIPERVRRIKDAQEIALIEQACDISCKAFANILPQIKEGMTEVDLQLALDFEMLKLGGEGLAFDTIVASGENGSLCHAIPGQRKLRCGDMITMDFGARKGGYCADMTRTVALGQPSAEMKKIYAIVLKAQEESQAALKAGMPGDQVDKIARDIIDNAGYKGCFGHGLGHSLGIDIHESPRCSQTCPDLMEENMLMTIEPGIYKAGVGGVRIENTCLIGADGARTLVHAPKDLLIL